MTTVSVRYIVDDVDAAIALAVGFYALAMLIAGALLAVAILP